MKYETFAAFLISVALPALAYPTGSSMAEADAGPAIEQRDEGADVERRDPAMLARPVGKPLRSPGWSRPAFLSDAIQLKPFPKVASRSDGDGEIERREPRRGKGKGNGNGNGQQVAGPGKVETATNVLNAAFPWVDMVNQQQQAKRSETAAIEQRAPRRGKGKGKGNNQNQQPGGPGKVETVTNVLNTAFPWVNMANQQQQPPQQKRSEAGIEARSPKRGKGNGNGNKNNNKNNNNNNNNNQGPGKVETATNVLDAAFPWVNMVNQQQQPPQQKRSEAGIEERAPKKGKGKGNNNKKNNNSNNNNNNNNNNQGPGKVETATNVLSAAFPWVDMVNQQQQQQQPQQKRSEAGIEERAPKKGKGKGNNNKNNNKNNNNNNNNNNNQGPGKVETATNVLNTAFPWVDMVTQQQQPQQKRSEAPSSEELADMLEAAAAGYLDETAERVVRRAVVAAMLA